MDRPERAAVRGEHRPGAGSRAVPAAWGQLVSVHPFERPWAALVLELKDIHAKVLELVRDAGDATPIAATAPFVMVVKVPGPSAPEVVEWVEALDWKAYAQALRIQTHEHCAQVERTVAPLSPKR